MAYGIRKHFREWEGQFSENDVIKFIKKGKLTQDDEFQVDKSGAWKKLSAHPPFYDTFLKKIFQGSSESLAQSPDVESRSRDDAKISSDSAPPSSSESAKGQSNDRNRSALEAKESPDVLVTRQDRRTHTRQPAAADGEEPAIAAGTIQIGHAARSRDGGTLHQAEIDALFKDSSQASRDGGRQIASASVTVRLNADGAEPAPHPNEASFPMISPLPGSVELASPLDVGPVEGHFEVPFPDPSNSPLRPRQALKPPIVLGGLVLLLVMLFQMSSSTKSTTPVGAKKTPATELYISLTEPKIRTETLLALQRQADILYDWHTPLFYLGAQEVYNEALSLDESNVEILGSLAESGARLVPESSLDDGIEKQVRGFIATGRSKEPQYAAFYRAEALIALHQDNIETAKKSINLAKEVDPANLENFVVEGEILLVANELSSAETLLQKVVADDPYSVQAKALLSVTKLKKKDYSGARELALGVLKLNPLHAGSYYVLGSVAFEQNRVDDTVQQYQTFVGLAKFAPRADLFRAYSRLGVIAENNGKQSQGKEAFQLAYYYFPERKQELGDKLSGSDLNLKVLEPLALKNEYGVQYFKERADSLLKSKNYRHALVFLHAAYLLSPHDGTWLIKIGDVAEKLADSYVEFRAVTSYYERAIERDPRQIQAYIKLGLLETDLYNLDRAYMLLKHAQTLAPDQAEPFVALGKYYYKAKDYVASVDQFTKAFKINGADPEILYYAGLLRPIGKADGEKEAMMLFYRAYLLNPFYYEAMIEWLKLKVKGYDKLFAIKFVRNLIEQDPDNANNFWALGEVYAANKEHRRAIEYFQKALEIDRFMSPVRLSLAKSLEAVGDLEDAVLEFRMVTRLDRRNGGGAYHAAEILLEAHRLDLAEKVLSELIQISPNYPGAYRYLARIAQAAKKKDKSIEYMRTEVKNNPLNGKFRMELASLLMDYQDYELAVTELTEVTNASANKTAPEFIYDKIRAYLLLSRCYRALDRLDSAEGAIGLAIDIDPEDPELHRELGYVYSGLQRNKEAAKAFEFYLNRSPAASDAASIRAMIQNMVVEV